MYTSDDIFSLLGSRNIEYRVVKHQRVFSIEEMERVSIEGKEYISKNIVLTDDKKCSFYLVSMDHERRLDLKALRHLLSSRALSFLNAEKMEEMIKIKKGEVTPFALLNDEEHKVNFVLSSSYENKTIGIHPNDNSMTIFLNTSDLIRVLKEHGVSVSVFELPYL